MPRKRHKPEEIVTKLRQVDVLVSQGSERYRCHPSDRRYRGDLRDELLDGEIFYTLKEAQIIVESWRRHYNTVRPYASLAYRPPAPEVFVRAFVAWPAAQSSPAPPATLTLALRSTLN